MSSVDTLVGDWRAGLEQRVALTRRASACGFWEWRLRDGAFRADPRFCELFGVSGEAVLAEVLRAVAGDDRRRFALELDDASRDVGRLDTEVAVRTAEGALRWIRVLADPVRDPDGGMGRLVGVCWDNTAAQHLSELAHDQGERLQITLASMADAVVTVDARARVTFLNPAAVALFGAAGGAAVGRPLDEVLRADAAEPRERLSEVALACIRSNAARRACSARLVGRDGEVREVDVSVSPHSTRAGQVRGAVLVIHDVTEQRRLEHELRHAAMHDPLTGLPNRIRLEEVLGRLLAPDAAEPPEGVLCYIDVDQFKIINDTAGHHAGDQFLRQMSVLLRNLLGPDDLMARVGGDEFVAVLRGCGLQDARARAQKLVDAAAEFRFHWAERVFGAGVSIGLCPIDPRFSPAELLSQCDLACYEAKAAGRRRVSVHRPDDETVRARLREINVAAGLKEVIRRNRLTLHAQRIVPAFGEEVRVSHVELLVRMVDDSGGLVSPNAFIPAAERFGLMSDIDRWVLREALVRLAPRIAGLGGFELSINLSGETLNQPAALAEMFELVESGIVAPSALTFEITETAALNSLAAASETVTRLRGLGCKVALDDFGVGLSSFSYLKNFPVDRVKIDGSFVRNIVGSDADRAIVEAMNSLAHRLGAETVAEFVESEAIAEALGEMGVDFLQGYAFGAPESFEGLLDDLAGAA